MGAGSHPGLLISVLLYEKRPGRLLDDPAFVVDMLTMAYTREDALTKPLFQPDGFNKLIDVAGLEAVINLADVFDAQGRERIEAIRAAIDSRDLDILENETHSLGSSAGTFGAERMHILARAAEAACMEGDVELTLSLCRDILDIADESFTQAAAFIASLGNETA